MGALSPEVYAVLRWLPESGEQALLLINRGEREQAVTLHPDDIPQGPDAETPITLDQVMTDVLTQDVLTPVDGEARTTLPPISARLYVTK